MSQLSSFGNNGGVLPPDVPTEFTTDAGTAIPVANNLNVFGGTGINTAGAGDTITINLDIPVTIANGGTNATAMTNTFGVNYFDGTRLVTTTVGTSSQVLTSNGPGVAPTFQAAGSGGAASKTTIFTSTTMWTKDASAKNIEIYLWDAGGGGAAGRQGLTTLSSGGGGGGAGGFIYYKNLASNFPASLTATVGVGGAGGASQTIPDTDGDPGVVGGFSSFGNIFTQQQQTAATGGNTTGVSGGTSDQANLWVATLTAGPSSTAGIGFAVAGTNATNVNSMGTAAGGGGGGADVSTPWPGGDGGDINFITITTAVPGGAGGIETGTINGGTGTSYSGITPNGFISGGAGGGGGGGQSVGLAAGNGGNGGIPGGGGGGGGGSLDGTNSGAGGNGGRGEIWVIEYF